MNKNEILIKALKDILNLDEQTIAEIVNYATPNIKRILKNMEKNQVIILINNLTPPINVYPTAPKDLDSNGKLLIYYIVKNSIKTETELKDIINCSQTKMSHYITEVSNQFNSPEVTLSLQ